MKTSIPDSVLRDVEAERAAAPYRGRGAVVRAAAARLGVDEATLYRALQTLRGRVKTVVRQSKFEGDVFDEIARRKAASARLSDDGRLVPTAIILADMAAEGTFENLPSESVANARLRTMGLHLRRTFRSFQSSFANEFCLVDFSRLKYFQLQRPEGDDWLLVQRKEELSYKADNRKLRTWIVNYVDHYSGLFVPRVYAASGESILLGLEHLDYVWTRAEDENPVRYVPVTLQTDRGSLGKSAPFKAAMQALGVDAREAQAKEAQGAVERRFRYLWQSWELPMALRHRAGTIRLSELNAELAAFAVTYGERRHPMQPRLTRGDAYRTSLRVYEPRTVEQSVLRFACRVETRRVDRQGTITVGGERFGVPQYVGGRDRIPTQDLTIRVYRNLEGVAMGELVDRFAEPFRLAPWEPNAVGEYRTHHGETIRQTLDRDLRAEEAAEKAQRAAARPKAPGKVRTLPPSPVPVETQGPFATITQAGDVLTVTEARVYVGRRLDAHCLRLADVEPVFAALFAAPPISRADADTLVDAVLNHRSAHRRAA